MHAKVVAIDIGCDGHGLEQADEELVDLLIVELLQDLRPEREVLSHGTRLVVASEHDDVAWVVELEAEEEDGDFEGEDTPVDVVAQEKKVCPVHGTKSRNSNFSGQLLLGRHLGGKIKYEK